MEHVTTDRRDSTSPSSLLHSPFFSCCFLPPPLFPSCTIFYPPFQPALLTHTFPYPFMLYAHNPLKNLHAHGHVPVLLASLRCSLFLSSLSFISTFLACGYASLKPQLPILSFKLVNVPLLPGCAFFSLHPLLHPSPASLPLAATPFPLGLPLSLLPP